MHSLSNKLDLSVFYPVPSSPELICLDCIEGYLEYIHRRTSRGLKGVVYPSLNSAITLQNTTLLVMNSPKIGYYLLHPLGLLEKILELLLENDTFLRKFGNFTPKLEITPLRLGIFMKITEWIHLKILSDYDYVYYFR